ncbi:DUF1707 domain-containing protein [Streptomyces sp. JJ36]|uniref:DUF1707 SHOCT-like domain-containing protein n=1 Tax=Streptomyces sp. JJ36 TaxID=2736645 RepID=UPI001F48F223|nr:DUF1707 domain-containing protein [Streptomyces sp. JJ36]MCF6522000.1 DUF1707 and DUF2154 domain-containing protein [Streptomyces sp. JJ36]
MTDSPLEKKTSLEKPARQPAGEPGPQREQSGRQPATRPAAEAEVRASDADRDRVADILREALAEGRLNAEEHSERLDAVYAAKTMGELEPLVRDLPHTRPGAEPAGQRWAYAAPAQHDGSVDHAIAIFSGATRKGRWRVGRKTFAFACFGGVDIDLTEAVFEHREIVINAMAIFGGVDVKVPENVSLRGRGTGIFGGFEVRSHESEDAGAPVVVIKGAAVFGGVEAKPKRGKRLRDLRKRHGGDPHGGCH